MACDITSYDSVHSAIHRSIAHPDVIINLAGLSDVDFCEKKENQELVIKTNVRGAYNVALAAEDSGGIPVVFISTDHVFDGKHGPYKENAKLTPPVNFYGSSKLAMEGIGLNFNNVKIVRTSYLFSYKRVMEVSKPCPMKVAAWLASNIRLACRASSCAS